MRKGRRDASPFFIPDVYLGLAAYVRRNLDEPDAQDEIGPDERLREKDDAAADRVHGLERKPQLAAVA